MQAEQLNEDGMVCDFSYIKKEIKDRMDHKNLNNLIPQPTAENIAKYICDLFGERCTRVEVQETANNIAIYER
jgi:6-pyruvoyltetrahydropterin/6-carboxytetrahydropterin synthase